MKSRWKEWLVIVVVVIWALVGLGWSAREGYRGAVYVRASHQKAQASFDYLAAPIQTKDGKTVTVADVLRAVAEQAVKK